MAFEEDLSVYLDLDAFADEVRFTSGATPAAYAPITCAGIFDAPFIDAKAADMQFETSGPQVQVRAADVVFVKRGDYCLVKGQTYDVVQVQPDGTGMAIVTLAAAT